MTVDPSDSTEGQGAWTDIVLICALQFADFLRLRLSRHYTKLVSPARASHENWQFAPSPKLAVWRTLSLKSLQKQLNFFRGKVDTRKTIHLQALADNSCRSYHCLFGCCLESVKVASPRLKIRSQWLHAPVVCIVGYNPIANTARHALWPCHGRGPRALPGPPTAELALATSWRKPSSRYWPGKWHEATVNHVGATSTLQNYERIQTACVVPGRPSRESPRGELLTEAEWRCQENAARGVNVRGVLRSPWPFRQQVDASRSVCFSSATYCSAAVENRISVWVKSGCVSHTGALRASEKSCAQNRSFFPLEEGGGVPPWCQVAGASTSSPTSWRVCVSTAFVHAPSSEHEQTVSVECDWSSKWWNMECGEGGGGGGGGEGFTLSLHDTQNLFQHVALGLSWTSV